MVMGEARKGLKVTYCTDTRPVPAITENAVGSDLFICEGMYGDPEKEAKAKDYRHMTMEEAAHLAADAKVREMWLTHYSPSLVRPADYMTWDAGLRRYSLELGAPEWQSIETRGCVVVETRHFGNVAVLPIGMCQVSSVNFLEGVKAGSEVRKGRELGYFLYGGSDFMISILRNPRKGCSAFSVRRKNPTGTAS